MTGPVDTPSPAFGLLLRRHREQAGLSREELAGRAGLSWQAIGALERGGRQRPYPATVRRLADALGLADGERAVLLAAAPHTTGLRRIAPPPSVRRRAGAGGAAHWLRRGH